LTSKQTELVKVSRCRNWTTRLRKPPGKVLIASSPTRPDRHWGSPSLEFNW